VSIWILRGTKIKVVFICLLFLSTFKLFGIEDFEKLCDNEIKKDRINKKLVVKYCTKAGDNNFNKKNYESASWYYLLGGDIDKNINILQKYINNKNSFVIYPNIGHCYTIRGDFDNANRLYLKYIEKQMQPNIDIQEDYKLLYKLYPKYKNNLDIGIANWNKLYKPLLELEELYDSYQEEEKRENYKEAIKKLERIISLRENYYHKDNENTSIDYNNLSLLYSSIGNYPKALEYCIKSLNIDKKLFGINYHTTAVSYSNLGFLYEKVSKYKKAEYNHLQALKIFKKLYGEEHKSISITYNNLGVFYNSIGKYQKSLEYYLKALKIDKKLLGEKHKSIATTYNNIGELYSIMGDYPKAIKYYNKTLEIDMKNYDINNTKIAISYNNIGQIYELIKDFKRSEIYLKKALHIFQKKLNKNHPLLATTHSNLGNLYYSKGDYIESLKEHKKALKIRKSVYGDKNIDLALSYNAIGLLFYENGDYNNSLEYFYKTLKLEKELLDKNNIANAVTYDNLGLVYKELGDNKKALNLYQKALNLEEKTFNKNHNSLAISYNSLSLLFFSQGEYQKAYEYNKKSFIVFLANRNQNFLILDSIGKSNYIKENAYRFSNLLVLTSLIKKEFIFVVNSWLNYKGTIFEYQNILSTIQELDPKIKPTIDNLKKLTIELDNLDNNDLNYENKNYNKIKSLIEEKIHNIEVNLSKQNRKFKEQLNLKDLTYTDISQKLKPNQLYIDFARGEGNYYIFTLDNHKHISFQQIDSNSTATIDKYIKTFLNINKTIANNINNKELIKNLKPKTDNLLSNLYNLLIKHNIKTKNIDELIISPDGLLNFLPFEALFDGKKYLVQDYTIRYISSGQEFIRQIKRKKQKNLSQVIVFANPNFQLEFSDDTQKGIDENMTLFDIELPKLKGGKKEIEIIKSHYKDVTIYQGDNATVDNLFKIKAPKILHISTHGIFLNNKNILNPMKRSALAFSGADNANYQGDARGFATALKLSSLNLEGTELVVLSACDTGRGEIQQAEGVVGLPKAFIQAGAKRVIMSLWSVSDNKTALLMRYFYDNISNGKGYAIALREAKLKMINLHPYFWSAFIIHGI